MDYTIGAEGIRRIVQRRHVQGYKKRYSYETLSNYVFHTDDARVCTLYGLRRTGKTTMMVQMMNDLLSAGKADEVLSIRAGAGDYISDLKKLLNEHPNANYIFIDEATKIEDFQGLASVLADRYAAEEGRRIVLTGTDSLGFKFAMSNELFDRTYVIHTTYIPFREYSYLLNVNEIDDYLRYGGTLTDGKVFYNRDNDGSTPDFEYTNSAIAKNIQHSLKHYDGGEGTFGSLYKFYAHDDLTTFINKLVEKDNGDFAIEALNKSFKSATLGAMSNIVGHSQDFDDVDESLLRRKDLVEKVRAALEIKDDTLRVATDEDVRAIRRYLKMMDVIHPMDDAHAIFTQPGLRYSQIASIVRVIQNDPAIRDCYPVKVQNELWKRLEENVLGHLMENVVFVDLTKEPELSNFTVSKFREQGGHYEFDVILTDSNEKKSYLIEVKHSKSCLPDVQAKHLLNPEACKLAEEYCGTEIAGKAVIYRGDNMDVGDGITYYNAAFFLCNPAECIKGMREVYEKDKGGSIGETVPYSR